MGECISDYQMARFVLFGLTHTFVYRCLDEYCVNRVVLKTKVRRGRWGRSCGYYEYDIYLAVNMKRARDVAIGRVEECQDGPTLYHAVAEVCLDPLLYSLIMKYNFYLTPAFDEYFDRVVAELKDQLALNQP